MKKYTIVIGLVVLLVWLPLFFGSHWAEDGTQIRPTYKTSPNSLWTILGSITCSKTALTTLDYSAVISIFGSKTVDWDIPAEADSIELRFQTGADGDAHIINVYLARGAAYTDYTEDSYILTNTIILRGGTQVGPNSNVFCCTVEESVDYGNIGATVDSTGSNTIEHYIITKLRGRKKMVIIATTLHSSATLYVDGAFYSE